MLCHVQNTAMGSGASSILPDSLFAWAVIIFVIVLPFSRRIYSRLRGVKYTKPLDNQSVVLTSSDSTVEIHACPPMTVDNGTEAGVSYGGRKLLHYLYEDGQTLYAMFKRAVRLAGDQNLLGRRAEGDGE